MFAIKGIVGGLINVVSNIDPGMFTPSAPPPTRRPISTVQAAANESDEDRQFRKIFQQLAGDDMEVSPNELMDILNKILTKRYMFCYNRHEFFSFALTLDKQCDSSGKLGFSEFKYLWNNIKRWQNIYKTYDADRSGTISATELTGAFNAAGFPLNQQLLQMIVRRYSDENGDMDFDNYIGCLVRLDAMCRAFKTLDKDNDGQVKVNIKEWLQLTMYS
ncbi:calpain small subunit 1 [Silurus asotus]|uniref:Calpain small subunit 1 n=1 Tax=Silurus asotus TaxID=30991 RepID=A0AAD5FRH4_SILAS|nr:calpain small subunit 1 [Silurus asotus]